MTENTMTENTLSLANLYDGAVIEAVDHALQEVFDNILDPNTETTKTREGVLKIKVKPNQERNLGTVTFQATAKLAPAQPLETAILIDRDRNGKAVAIEHFTRPKGKLLPLQELQEVQKV